MTKLDFYEAKIDLRKPEPMTTQPNGFANTKIIQKCSPLTVL